MTDYYLTGTVERIDSYAMAIARQKASGRTAVIRRNIDDGTYRIIWLSTRPPYSGQACFILNPGEEVLAGPGATRLEIANAALMRIAGERMEAAEYQMIALTALALMADDALRPKPTAAIRKMLKERA